jgi:hypothetical protein
MLFFLAGVVLVIVAVLVLLIFYVGPRMRKRGATGATGSTGLGVGANVFALHTDFGGGVRTGGSPIDWATDAPTGYTVYDPMTTFNGTTAVTPGEIGNYYVSATVAAQLTQSTGTNSLTEFNVLVNDAVVATSFQTVATTVTGINPSATFHTETLLNLTSETDVITWTLVTSASDYVLTDGSLLVSKLP